MSQFVRLAKSRLCVVGRPGFHLQMACATAAIWLISFIGCRLVSIQEASPGNLAIGMVVVLAAWLSLPFLWYEKGKMHLLEASLTVPWALLIAAIIRFPVAIAARMGAGIGLQDGTLMRWDQSFGVSVPKVVAWASHHWLGELANHCYPYLEVLLVISFLLPALTGKVKEAQQFITANLVAFAIGIPLSAVLPSIGPWYGYHFAATHAQMDCQRIALLIRQPGVYALPPDVLICFPSFHVIWAIIFARALWCFRRLRLPVALLSALIIVSTLTTGWHYFIDVLGGMLVATVAIVVAGRFSGVTPAESQASILKMTPASGNLRGKD